MKPIYFYIICVLCTPFLKGQPLSNLDTIDIIHSYSNIPVLTDVETIHLCLGRPKDVVFNSPYYYRVNGRQKMISNEFVNFFRFDNNVTFVEKDNKVRLLAIDLSKNKKAYFKISDTLRLSYNFTLNNLCEIFKFNINDEDFPPLVPDIIPFYVDGENKFRFFTFYTGESEGVRIELYFDIYDRLRVIYIEPYFE